MFRRILVPVDGSTTANKALETALQIAKQSEGQIRVVNALDELAYIGGSEFPGNIIQIAREQAQKTLDAALADAQAVGVPADKLLIEQPAQRLGNTIAKAVEDWNADLVVVGTHGRRGIGRVLLGSGAEQIIRQARVPVLVIRGEGED
jgi:nucleotide-binding universal stress UspA family protein